MSAASAESALPVLRSGPGSIKASTISINSGKLGALLLEGVSLPREVRLPEFGQRAPTGGILAGDKKIQQHADAIDVARRRWRMAVENFRCEVERRAGNLR